MKTILSLAVLLLLLPVLLGASHAGDAAGGFQVPEAVPAGQARALVTGSGDDAIRIWLEGTRYAPRIRAEGVRAPRLQADLDRLIAGGGYTPGSVSAIREGRYLHLTWEDRTYRTFRTFYTRLDLEGIEPPASPVPAGGEGGVLGLYRGSLVVESTDPLTRRMVIAGRGDPGRPFLPNASVPSEAVTLSQAVDIEEGSPGSPPVPVSSRSILQTTGTRRWTYFCYMDGDNNLDPYGDDDFDEFLAAGSTPEVTLVVLKDKRGDHNSHLYVIDVGGGSATEIPLGTVNHAWTDEVDMGDPQTLSTVAKWVIANYPSDHLAIDLWDHGSGISGLLTDTTSMDMAELRSALSDVARYRGRPVDVLAYDACSMGQAEVFYQVKAYADVQVGSADLVTADGFPYNKPGASILGDLGANPQWTAREFAARMVEHFRTVFPLEPMSATDMDAFDSTLMPALSDLSQAMKHQAGSGHAAIQAAMDGAYSYGGFPDLGNFTAILATNQTVSAEIRDACGRTQDALSSAVYAQAPGDVPDATDLSITIFRPGGYGNLRFAVETPWDEFLTAFYEGRDRPNTPPVITISTPGDGTSFLLPAPLGTAGTAWDPDGILQVEVKLDRNDWQTVGGTTVWNTTLDTAGLGAGTHRFWARSMDARGSGTTDRDYSPPRFRTFNVSTVPARYHSLAEIEAELAALEADHPGIVRRQQIGISWEGRPLWAVVVSHADGGEGDRPAIFIQALQHTDERISGEVALGLLHFLAEHYGTDPRVTEIVDRGEIWVVPVANPDGLAYMEQGHPSWRKNRRNNGDGTFGVDLNRNYEGAMNGDPAGAWCQVGASHSTGQETYCGPEPFSEPETRAIRDLVSSRKFMASLNYHSAGETVSWPWGYTTSAATPDNDTLTLLGTRLASRIPRAAGQGTYTPLQSSRTDLTSGDLDDWTYGYSRFVMNRTVPAFTIEVGQVAAPPESQVPAIVAAQLESQLSFAQRIIIGNLPPDAPAVPSGTGTIRAGTPATFTTSAEDPDGDRLRFLMDWGDGAMNWTGWVDSGTTVTGIHSWQDQGSYLVRAMAFDTSNASSPWSGTAALTVTEAPNTRAPDQPAPPAGPALTQTIFATLYTARATDPDGDAVVLRFDWGDGTWTESGQVPSGTPVQASHTWTGPGTFIARVQATDIFGVASEPSPPLAVKVLRPDATLSISDKTNTKVYIGSAYNRRWTAQGFTPKKPWVTGLSLPLRRQGLPIVPLSVMIRTSPGPSGGSTLAQASILPSQVPAEMGWVNVTFDAPADTTGRSSVYLLLSTGSTANTSAYYQGYLDNTHPYAGGIWYYEQNKNGDPNLDMAAFLTFAASASGNRPPLIPSAPLGPAGCHTGDSCEYTVTIQDPDGDLLRGTFDWGDGTTWVSDLVPSGTTVTGAHAWTSPGSYAVRVRAADASGAASGWSPVLTVTVSDLPGTNHPPEMPEVPSGPVLGTTGQSLDFSSHTADPDGDDLTFTFDWDDGSTSVTDLVPSGTTVTGEHVWSFPGTFAVRVMAADNKSAASPWSDILNVTITGTGNRPPDIPASPTGPAEIAIGAAGEYRVVASDPDGDQVACTFDWGDGTQNITSFQASGSTHAASHIWTVAGTYPVRVKARDAGGGSEWSPSLSVAVSPPAGTLVIATDPNTRVYLGSAFSRRWHSEGFRAIGSRITGASLTMGREGSPAMPLQVMIRTTPNPATGISRGQANLTPDRVGAGPAPVEVTFDPPVTVKEGGLYYLVVSTGTAYNSKNHYYGYADYQKPYPDGIWYYEQQPQGNANLDMVAILRFG